MTRLFRNSLITLFISVALFIIAILSSSIAFAVSTATVNDSEGVNMRKGPGTDYEIVTSIANKTVCTIIDSAKDKNGDTWYKCEYKDSKGKTYTGYMIGKYLTVKIDEEEPTDPAIPFYDPQGDFEKYMDEQGFPEAYKPYLRTAHNKYPNWIFVAQNTGLSWSNALSKEASNHTNLVHKSYPDSWKSEASGDYNPKTGEYTVYDSGGWVAASKEIVAYYLDPRNFLKDNSVFMFLAQSYNKQTQTKEGLASIIDGTFLDAKFPEKGYDTYADALIYAAQQSNVSPYLLASMILIEQGTKGQGGCINDGKYWNYYNWGAYASGGNSAVENGIEYAASGTSYMRPWNTRLKSIVGGAIYYADGYINNKQDTLYLKKFNVMNGLSEVGTHQYMTNVRAAYDEALECAEGYDKNFSLTFYIPVYKSMPEKASPKPSDNITAQLSWTTTTYNGNTKKPAVTVTDSKGGTLVKDTDYTVTYASGRKNAGTYKVTVKGIGKYSFTKTLTFTIKPAGIESAKLSYTSYTYTGKTKTPVVTVTDKNGNILEKDKDYTVTYPSGRKNVGTYEVKVDGKGNYSFTETLTFKIKGAGIESAKLSWTTTTFNGNTKKPAVTVINKNGNTLINGTDYTVTYASGRKNAGSYDVTVKGKGNYSFTEVLTFTIKPAGIESAKLSWTTTTFNGNTKKPAVTVIDKKGNTLTNGTDYTVTYPPGRKNVGTYKVTVNGIGNYSFTETLTFKIKAARIDSAKLSWTSTTYNGNTKKPSVTVIDKKGNTLTKDTDYTVTYASGRKNVGTYKVTVNGIGNYSFTEELTFKIKPAKATISSVIRKSATSITVKWSKVESVTGYQIKYVDSKGTSKTVKVNGASNISKVVTELTKGETYNVSIRTYKTVDKTTYYSGYSEAQSIEL